jgi:hypothetical protein
MPTIEDLHSLDEYLAVYGKLLARHAEQAMTPLHSPGRDDLFVAELKRKPFEPQAHVICAGAKALTENESLMVIGEMGVGKTLIAQGIVETHNRMTEHKAAYRAIVMCPGQLVKKWEREILETVPNARVIHIESHRDLVRYYRGNYRLVPETKRGRTRMVRSWLPADKPTWYIVARDRAKLGAKWEPVWYQRRKESFIRCPSCCGRLTKKGKENDDVAAEMGENLAVEDLQRRRMTCHLPVRDPLTDKLSVCGEPLWQMTGELRRYEPAHFIHKKMKGYFDYFIGDEAHEEKGANTAQANAFGALAASARKCLALTGTLIGGYAEHVRTLLFRLSPTSLVEEGFAWSQVTAFSEKYGRIETRVTERERASDSNRQSRGTSKNTQKYIRPGIMPTLFGRHLMQNAVFLGLEEVAANLPVLEETVCGVDLDSEIGPEYLRIQKIMEEVIKDMVARKDKRFLGTFLQTLLAYPDYPFGWDTVGYYGNDAMGGTCFIPVVKPANFDERTIRPKEQKLLDIIEEERRAGRQVWVYTVMTGERDVATRLKNLITKAGVKAEVLTSAVELKKREEWIERHGPKNDVIISHPKLVETGLDLFDKGGKHNFPTLVFYATGYNLFTLRQASRRSWRIGQRLPCKVYYLFYNETMQARAMSLMGRKLTAAQAIEGKFSSDGLVAMSGDEGIEMALAKSLAERIDEGCPTRQWVKVGSANGSPMTLEEFGAQMNEMEAEARTLFPELFTDEETRLQAAGFQEAA